MPVNNFEDIVKSSNKEISMEREMFRGNELEGVFNNATTRKNIIFERQINQASIKGGTSDLTKEEVKIFYAATQKMWQGKDPREYNKTIMEKLGTNSLEKAWEKIFKNEEVKKKLEEARANQEPAHNEDDVSDGTNEEKDEKGSPQYIADLIKVIDTNNITFS